MQNDSYLNDLQNRAFDLCLAIYRMVKYFPEREALVNQIKSLTNEFTANILILDKTSQNITSDICLQAERLTVYLRIAGTQGWLNPINFDFLINGYEKLKKELLLWENMNLRKGDFKETWSPAFPPLYKTTEGRGAGMTLRQAQGKQEIGIQGRKEGAEKKEIKKPIQAAELNQRQKKILDFLKKHQEAKMNDLQGIFKGEVTERTLRNDLQSLVAQRAIRSEGEFKTRKYFSK